MALKPIDIILRALGTEQSEQKVESAARGMAGSVKSATGKMSREFTEAQKRVERLEAALQKRPGNLGIQKAAIEARELRDELQRAATQAATTNRALQQIKAPGLGAKLTGIQTLMENQQPGKYDTALSGARNAGVGMAAAGVGGLMLGNHFIQEANADNATTSKMEDMLKKRGEGSRLPEMKDWAGKLAFDAALPDDDPLKEATAQMQGFGLAADQVKSIMPGLIGQSRLYNQSLETSAQAMGKAFANGDVSQLKRTGVTFSPEEEERIKNISDYGERQKAVIDAVRGSMDKFALSLTAGMSDAEIATNRATLAMDDLNTNVGTGAAAIDASVKTMGSSLVNFVFPTKGAQEFAGAALEVGSYTLTAVGGIVSFGAQLGFMVQGLGALKAARAANAATSGVEAAATAGSTLATAADATAKTTGTAAVGVNTLAVEGNAAAMVVQTATTGQATAATILFTEASLAAKIGVAGIAIAAAATVGAVAFAVGQHIGWINNELSYVDSLSLGWKSLGDRIGLTSHAAQIARNEIDANAEIQKARLKNAEDADSGKITREEEQKRNRDVELQWRERQAQTAKRLGNNEEYLRQHEAAAQLRQQTTSITAMPTLSVPAGSTPALDVATLMTGASGSTPDASLQPQIEALSDKISATKDKTAKAELNEQLIKLRRVERDRKAAVGDAKAAQRLADKAADYASGVEKMRADTGGDLEKMRGDAAAKIAANKAKIGLDSQIGRINDLKDAGVLDEDTAQNQIDRLKHAYEVRNAAMEKDALMRSAQVESQAEIAAAQAEASTQEAAQAKATMEKARIKAGAILEKAKIAASVIGTDIAPLEEKQSKFAALSSFLKSGGSLIKPMAKGFGGAGASGDGGAMFGMRSGNYGAQDGAFSVTRGGWNGRTIFDEAYRNKSGQARTSGRNRQSPTAYGKVIGQTPAGKILVQFATLEIDNPLLDALEAIG